MNQQTYTVVIFAILAAFGLITVVAVDIILDTQEAEARGCENGPVVGLANTRSQGHCSGH